MKNSKYKTREPVRWYAHAPGMVYAVNVYACDEREARAVFRENLGAKRLPAGSAVWKG